MWQADYKVWSGYSRQFMYICVVVHCAQHRGISTTGAFMGLVTAWFTHNTKIFSLGLLDSRLMADNANNGHKGYSEEYDPKSPISKRAGKLLLLRPLFLNFL